MLEELKNKKILILGFDREGKDSFLFLRKLFPQKKVGIADKSEKIKKPDKKTVLHLGKNYLKSIKNYDVIIKSPGIPFKILPKQILKKITTQTKIFFNNCPGKIIGVTGTKGKSTTSAMIHAILKAGKIKAYLMGNIGNPVLSSLLKAKKDDVFVCELSSFQLTGLKKSPHIAVFLNVFPEHLDYYKNFKEYAGAKANITSHQTKNDYLVYNSSDKIVKKIASFSPAKKIPVKGTYYELDKTAAGAVGRIFKISPGIIHKTIKKFKYLPHRLEPIGTFQGITFYNDALATIPEATMEAINALGSKVETIILGGFDRNIDFKKLAKKILESKIKTVILFPTTGERIWKDIVRQNEKRGSKKSRELKHFFVNEIIKNKSSSSSFRKNGVRYMKNAVKLAYEQTKTGKICLLSTASSSFSIFKDYKEKGDLFKKQVFAQQKSKIKQ